MPERILRRIARFFGGSGTPTDCSQEVDTPRGRVIRTPKMRTDDQRPITIVGLAEEHPPLQTAVKMTEFDH